MMNLKVRLIVAVIFAVSFIIELFGLIGVVIAGSWQLMPEWEKTLLLFSVLVEFCGILLAFWAYEDRKKIDELWKTVSKPKEQTGEK